MKRIIAAAIAVACSFTLFLPAALAVDAGEERVTMGCGSDRAPAAKRFTKTLA
jgi:hypothetical protein